MPQTFDKCPQDTHLIVDEVDVRLTELGVDFHLKVEIFYTLGKGKKKKKKGKKKEKTGKEKIEGLTRKGKKP